MDLQEEYRQRHSLDSPVVCFPDTNGMHALIVRNPRHKETRQPRYIVYTMQCHKQELHPTYIKFTQSVPTRDQNGVSSGVGGGVGGLREIWSKKVYVDEWQDFISQWSEANREELVPLQGDDLKIAIWEMYALAFDTWLSTNLIDRLKDSLCIVIDDSANKDERIKASFEVEEFLRGKHKNVVSTINYLRSLSDEKKHYGSWLAKLI